ncbi:MAG: sugar phosphate isomerase/epimerase family protein [Armatimonadota bacterium]
MKLSVITDEISMDFAHALDVMRKYNANGAELRSLWGKSVVDMDDDDINEALAILHDKGAVVSCIASPLYKCDLHTDVTVESGNTHQARARVNAEQLALLDHCIKLADKFDTRLVRVFSFWKKGELTPEIEDQIAEELSQAAEVAKREGITLVLENEHACYLGSGKDTARMLKRIDSPSLRAIWDPGNAYCTGEIPFPDGYNAIKDFVAHVHLKDATGADEKSYRFIAIGDGEIDFPGQLAALKNDGYTGWLSLETHFSLNGDGEAGSTRCLATLNSMLENI